MTDEPTATLVVSDTESGNETEFPLPGEESSGPAEVFLPPPDRYPEPTLSPNGTAPPRLRTAWKPRQDGTQPGKPSAKRAMTRGSARPGAGGVRAHVPGPDGLPKLAPIAPPLPKTKSHAPPSPPGMSPPTLRQTAPRAAVFYPSTHGINPKARQRRAGSGPGQEPPSGTILSGMRHGPRWPEIQKWLGTALIAVGVLIAVGAVGGNYLMQRHTESENEAFTASLSQFGPTPTPLTARATMIAARAGGIGAPVGATPTIAQPRSSTVSAMPVATSVVMPNATAAGTAPQPTPVVPSPGARPTVQGVPVVISGGRPGSAGVGIAVAAPPPTVMPPPMTGNMPMNGTMPTAPPPMAPVMPTPQPMTMPAPAPDDPMATPVPAADNPMATAVDMGDQTMIAMEPEPTPDAPPKQPLPTHIAIPSIGVNSSIIEVGISPTEIDGQQVYIWDVAAYAVGHNFSSASPGEGDNVVLSGHDDWQGEVFRDLYKLKKGDKISVQAGDKTWQYHVDTLLLLQEVGAPLEQRLNNALYIGSTGDERLTLITCWPYGIDDHRIVVIAYPDDGQSG